MRTTGNSSNTAKAARRKNSAGERACITTACQPCRKRKTKCDGTLPVCFTCQSYKTECAYNFSNDGRRRPTAAYVDALRSRVDQLENILRGLKNGSKEDVAAVLSQLRSGQDVSEILDKLQSSHSLDRDDINASLSGLEHSENANPSTSWEFNDEPDTTNRSDIQTSLTDELSKVMSQLDMDDGGEVRYVGPSSNLNLVSDVPRIPPSHVEGRDGSLSRASSLGKPGELAGLEEEGLLGSIHNDNRSPQYYNDFITPTNRVAPHDDAAQALEDHLLALYWTWQHPFFTLFSRSLFLRDNEAARAAGDRKTLRTKFFSPLLLNAILAHASHLSPRTEVRSNPNDPATAGNRYFAKARKLLEIECESPGMTTAQALALMGSREAGCGRDVGLGWLYSGMSFRMALDLGLHLSCEELVKSGRVSQEEADVRVITFWGCYLFDKGWSAYLGRPESIPAHLIENTPRPSLNPEEEFAMWTPYGDDTLHREPMVAHTMATSQRIVAIADILGSVIRNLYPATSSGLCSNYAEVVTQHHSKLLSWLHELPSYLRVRNHGYSTSHLLPHVLVMHMLYHTTTILVFRPLISHSRSKLLPEPFDPLGSCTGSAVKISTLAKAYRTRYSLRNIVNIAVHAVFTASTIHLSNLASANISYAPNARQYLGQCMSFLEEMGEAWPSGLRSLHVIRSLMVKYGITDTFGTLPPTTTTASSEEETSPKDYTYEERREQAVPGSLPTMPQLLPQASIATQQREIQTYEPDEGFQPMTDPDYQGMGGAEVSQQPQQYYIPTDFDMSFFDVPDMSVSMFDTQMMFGPNG